MRVKICGLVRRDDALVADRAGADYLGVVLSGGYGRSVDPARAAQVVAGMRARRVAVLVDESPDTTQTAAAALDAQVLQLHGDEGPDVLEELRRRGPWTLWKAVRARTLADVERAVDQYASVADGILLEGWKEGPLGAGGARLELEPARVRELIPEPVDFVLAGGLDAENVRAAASRFLPDVVDVSSGVEAALGEKEHGRVRAFVEAARWPVQPSAPKGAR